jgi:hypothetical protein
LPLRASFKNSSQEGKFIPFPHQINRANVS